MIKNTLTLLLTIMCSYAHLIAQITCAPVFPTADDDITLTYDASQGSRGLAGFTGAVYGHFGAVIASPTSTAWTNVQGTWGVDFPRTRMTSIGNDKYTISFNIRTFFGVAAGTPIYRIGCVFRNVDGSKEGKNTANADMFYDITQPGQTIQTRIITPFAASQLLNIGGTIAFKGSASQNATLTLKDNGVQIATTSNVRELTNTVTATSIGAHTVVFKAVNGAQSDSASFQYVVTSGVQTAALPVGVKLGANVNTLGDSITFVFQAPNKQNVFVIGSFNDYQIQNNYQMNRTADGTTWWLKIGGLTPNQIYTYQYLVDGSLKVADPLSILILDPNNDSRVPSSTFPNMPVYPTTKTTGYVSVIQPGKAAYNWRVPNFTRPEKTNLVIYELLPRDFIAKHDYQTLIDTLNYLKKLNINAIELMPVSEFDNNESWGYNPTFHMALDKYYGTPDKFKEFIDVCHQNGIAVILDVVFNHIWGGSTLSALYLDGGRPALDNPWLNRDATHPYNVGYDMNHESALTKAYVDRCLAFWLKEYNVDGFRFDLSKGFTQRNNPIDVGAWGNYDQSRIDILTHYHQTVQQTTPGAYSIMEHFATNSEETVLANSGMMLWGNANYNYNEATMGYSNNGLSGVSAPSRGWTNAGNADKLVGYMESHDEQRLMFKNLSFGNVSGNYSIKTLPTALRRIELASAFFYTVPGPKMLWQFGELGYDISIDQDCRICNKPILWNYLTDPNRKRLRDVVSNIIYLRTTQAAFKTLNFDQNELNGGYIKRFHITDASLNAVVAGNFNVVAENITPNFQHTGKWYDYLTGDSLNVTNTGMTINYLAGEYHIYLDKKITPPSATTTGTTGTQEFNTLVNDFQVYPTPSVSGQIFVGYNLRSGGEVSWDVFNIQGQQMATSGIKTLTQGSYQDAVQMVLPKGTYIVRLSVNGVSAMQKLIVQ